MSIDREGRAVVPLELTEANALIAAWRRHYHLYAAAARAGKALNLREQLTQAQARADQWQKAFEGQRKLAHLLQDRLDEARATILANDRDRARAGGLAPNPPLTFHQHATQAIRLVHPPRRGPALRTDRRRDKDSE